MMADRPSLERAAWALPPRLVQLFAATFVTMLLALASIPKPIDDVPWVIVAQTSPKQPSGKIVLVDTSMPGSQIEASPAARKAAAIALLSKEKPEAIFIEGTFASDDPGIGQLREAIAQSTVPVTVAWPIEFVARTGEGNFVAARKADLPGAREAIDSNIFSITGFIWEGERSLDIDGRRWQVFSSAIAGDEVGDGTFPIDYRYAIDRFPSASYADIEAGALAPGMIAGKRVVVAAASGPLDRTTKTPTQWRVPTVLVAMVAAETLVQGAPKMIDWPLPLVLAALLLALAAILPAGNRRAGYAMVLMIALLAPFATVWFDIFTRIGAAWALLVIYFAVRARAAWRDRAASREKHSGLPNFNALETEFAASDGRLVVARVDRYDEILASLEPALHRNFIRQIAQRLSVGRDNTIYTDSTGHFAWFADIDEAPSHIGGLLALANAPIQVDRRTFDFTCSFGILDCTIDKPRQAISATVVAADTAAERSGHIAMVSEQLEGDVDWKLALHASLDHAIANGQIYLVYQPQSELDTGRITGAEALVRWEHPERGLISPTEFIPQIEKVGRLKPLTAHTLRLASETARRTAATGMRISTNVSATLIADDDFVKLVTENVAAGGARPDAITVEITETARIADHTRAARNLEALRERGFSISLDDFGTGEANLSLLVALPCDEIKIDRSFVMLAQFNARARMIVKALAETARFSGLVLIAEGVETESDRKTLMELGCEFGQGYLFGKPMPEAQLMKRLSINQEARREKLGLY